MRGLEFRVPRSQRGVGLRHENDNKGHTAGALNPLPGFQGPVRFFRFFFFFFFFFFGGGGGGLQALQGL